MEAIIVWLMLALFTYVGFKRDEEYSPYIPLLFSVVFGSLLRLLFLDFPFDYHHDERWKVAAVTRMLEQGTLNPKYFLHPSLLLYLTLILQFFVGDIQLSGRIVSATAGILTIPVVFYGLKNLVGKNLSSVATFLFAVNPLAITCSRYLKEDSLLVLFTTATLFLVLNSKRDSRLSYLAAITAGLALGTKYTGLLSVGILLFSKIDFKKLPLLFLISGLTFIISTPYSVLDFQSFIDGVLYEKRHAIRGNTIPISFFSHLGLFHFYRGLLPSYLFVGVLLLPLGFGILRKHLWWILLGLIVFYLPSEIVRSKIEPQPERYILPSLPILSLLAAGAISSLKFKRLWLVFLTIPGIIGTLELKSDSRERMAAYIKANIPRDSKILIDNQFNSPKLDGFTNVEYLKTRPLALGFREEFHPNNLRKRGFDYALVSNFTYRCLLYCKEAPELARNGVIRLFRRLPLVHQEGPLFFSIGFHSPTVSLLKVTETDQFQSELKFGPNPFWIVREPFDRMKFLESKK
jgi:hypothetical protein